MDVSLTVATFKYFAGFADKIHGKTIEVCDRLHLISTTK